MYGTEDFFAPIDHARCRQNDAGKDSGITHDHGVLYLVGTVAMYLSAECRITRIIVVLGMSGQWTIMTGLTKEEGKLGPMNIPPLSSII